MQRKASLSERRRGKTNGQGDNDQQVQVYVVKCDYILLKFRQVCVGRCVGQPVVLVDMLAQVLLNSIGRYVRRNMETLQQCFRSPEVDLTSLTKNWIQQFIIHQFKTYIQGEQNIPHCDNRDGTISTSNITSIDVFINL